MKAVICPIFPSTYFQIPFSINVAYVQHIQQHLQYRLFGDVSSILEGIYLGLDSRAKSPILSIGDNAPWVIIKQPGKNFKVYGYLGNHDPPEILERGTLAAAYDVPTGGTIILACHNGLVRKNHGNVSLLPPFMMREVGWKVRDVSIQNCTEDGDPKQHCLIMPTSRDKSYLKLDLEFLNTHPSLKIRRPTAKDISYLPWY